LYVALNYQQQPSISPTALLRILSIPAILAEKLLIPELIRSRWSGYSSSAVPILSAPSAERAREK
jgi:hypothetical protein